MIEGNCGTFFFCTRNYNDDDVNGLLNFDLIWVSLETLDIKLREISGKRNVKKKSRAVDLLARRLEVKNLSAQHRNPNSWESSSACFGKLQIFNTTVSIQNTKADRNGEIIIFFFLFQSRVVNTKRTQTHFSVFFLFSLSKNKITQAWAVWLTKTNSLRRRRLDPYTFIKNG